MSSHQLGTLNRPSFLDMGTLHIDLPQDILPLIVAELRRDSPALRTLSLVSRQWLHEAQRHLFARLMINDARPERNIVSFCRDVLENQTICSNLRVLRIMNHATQSALELVELIIQLPNLQSLKLEAFHFTPCAASTLHERVRSLPKPLTIPFLELKNCASFAVNRPYDCMFDFIRAFSSVNVLSIRDPWLDKGKREGKGTVDEADNGSPSKKTSVTRLIYSVYEVDEVGGFTALLLESLDMENLSCLGLIPWCDAFFDYQTMLQSVLDASAGIRYLRMELSEYYSKGILNPLSLSLFRNLEVIELLFLPQSEFGARDLFEYKENGSGGCQMLSSLASSYRFSPQQSPLSKVRFEVWLGSAFRYSDTRIAVIIRDIQWSELVTTLEPFRGLKTVEVIYYTPHPIASIPTILEQQLSDPEDPTASLGSGPKKSILDSTRSQLAGLARRSCEVVVREEISESGHPTWK